MNTCKRCWGTGQERTTEYRPRWITCGACDGTGDVSAANYQLQIADKASENAGLARRIAELYERHSDLSQLAASQMARADRAEAERDQWAEWNGQACVRAEQAEDRAEKLERERDKLRELVRKAFNEGVESALDDHRRYHGGVVWPDSKSYAALAVLKDAKPTPDPGVHLDREQWTGYGE